VVLANEVTRLVRGDEAALTAEATAATTFAGGAGEDLPSIALEPGMTFAAALTALGFTASNGEAKRKAAEGAVKLDGEPVADALAPARAGRISLGKKRHGVLV
jgi:tyrosyl-tRNA synthetase